jgi:hypothetical protein
VFWGGISSSGVPQAIIDYWAYWEAIRLYGPKKCIHTTQQFVQILDGILIDQKDDTGLTTNLKTVFGLGNITWDKDFASTLANNGIGGWQGRNWDPEASDPSFANYCANITSDKLLYSGAESLHDSVEEIIEASERLEPTKTLVTSMLNWIGYVNSTLVQPCASRNSTQDSCYATTNATFYGQTDLDQAPWKSWTWQYCTQ